MDNMFSLLKQKAGWLVLALAIFLVDQLTKYIAVDSLVLSEPRTFLPYFNFTLLHNYGAAFSFLSDAGGWQRWLLGLIALLVSLFLVVWILRLESSKKRELLALSFVLGGAIGNLWDRIFLGYVVDFIDWFYSSSGQCFYFFYARTELQTCHWPAFNIADAAIFIGAALLIIDMFVPKREV